MGNDWCSKDGTVMLLSGDVLARLAEVQPDSIQVCVTSPPYWGLRDYGVEGQLGLELTLEEYVFRMVEMFREVRRVLREGGTLWLNLGDSYATSNASKASNAHPSRHRKGLSQEPSVIVPRMLGGLKPKDLAGIPWRVAFALQADGWYLRQDIIWSKPNPMQESVRDRCTKAHEYLFLLSKSPRYYYDQESIREPVSPNWSHGKGPPAPQLGSHVLQTGSRGHQAKRVYDEAKGANRRSVWTIYTQRFPDAHFAVMPEALCEPCIMAGSKPGDLVLDPFVGSGTVGAVSASLGRSFIGIDLNSKYLELARRRVARVMNNRGFFTRSSTVVELVPAAPKRARLNRG